MQIKWTELQRNWFRSSHLFFFVFQLVFLLLLFFSSLQFIQFELCTKFKKRGKLKLANTHITNILNLNCKTIKIICEILVQNQRIVSKSKLILFVFVFIIVRWCVTSGSNENLCVSLDCLFIYFCLVFKKRNKKYLKMTKTKRQSKNK